MPCLFAEHQPICIGQHPEDISHNFASQRYNFFFIFFWTCSVMPFHAVVLYLSQWWNQLSLLCSHCWMGSHHFQQHVVKATTMKIHVSLFVFVHEQVGNPVGTNFVISQQCYHLLDSMVSCAKLYCDFSHTLLSTLISMSAFFSLCSVVLLLILSQHGWLAVSLFLSVRYFTHLMTLLSLMQASLYT